LTTLQNSARARGRWLLLVIIVGSIAGSWILLQYANQPAAPLLANTTTPSEDSQTPPRSLAPDFSLTDLEGTTFQLSDFRGRVVIIDFMATWCSACRAAIPHFGTIWEQYADHIVLMSIDVDPFESEETIRDFANEFPYATWIWAKDSANLLQLYHVTAIPLTVVIDQDGYIRFIHAGISSASTLSREIETLLR
jgi:thiol-disulfide isomerase/thioredoxin